MKNTQVRHACHSLSAIVTSSIEYGEARVYDVREIIVITCRPMDGVFDMTVPQEYIGRMYGKIPGTREGLNHFVYASDTIPIAADAPLGIDGDIFVAPGSVQVHHQGAWMPWISQPGAGQSRYAHPFVEKYFLAYKPSVNMFGYAKYSTITRPWKRDWGKSRPKSPSSIWKLNMFDLSFIYESRPESKYI